MTVTVTIGSRDFAIATPYKLGQLTEAAPFLDAMNATARAASDGAKPSMVEMTESFRNMLGAILPGIRKENPEVTLDSLVDDFDPDRWTDLRIAFDAIFKRSGLGEGEVKAAVEAGTAAA